MSKGKDSSPAETAGGEEFSVEKVLDRRVVKGKVCNFNIYIHIYIYTHTYRVSENNNPNIQYI